MDTERIVNELNGVMNRLTYAYSSAQILRSIEHQFQCGNKDIFIGRDINFWRVVTDNCAFRVLAELAKIYDEDRESAGLHTIFNQVEQTEKGKATDILQVVRLRYDRVKEKRDKLKLLRDKGLFHSDKRYAGDLKELTSKNRFLPDDQDALIECAAQICNKLLEYYTGQQRAIETLFPCDVGGIVEDVKKAKDVNGVDG